MSGIAVILVAAGDGSRLGQGIPKALVKIGNKSLVEHSLERILKINNLVQIVVASHENQVSDFEAIGNQVIQNKVPVQYTPGGLSRQGSIFNALQKVNQDVDVVLVHDAARCFAPTELYETVAHAVSETNCGVIPVLPIADSIKQVEGDVVFGSVDRDQLRLSQTPQGFKYQELVNGYAEAQSEYTDDAALMQAAGLVIHSVPGSALAFKITVPADLDYARKMIGTNQRTGIGTDVHRFTEDKNKPLFLGAVLWENEVGLDGHSDGDAISHAIVDALLAAAGLGDIGSNFGVDKPEYAGANGAIFIASTLKMLEANGYSVVNVSVQLIGNKPKVGPNRVKVEQVLTALLGAPVSLGATTTDGLGFLGNSEGVAAVATALIESRL